MINLVRTKQGLYRSVRSNAGYALFRGIPYAKPPVGDLRWRAPEEPEPFEGIQICDTYGDACAQYDRWETSVDDITDDSGHSYIHIENYPYPPKMSEDCLYLNIYTPADSENDRLPVMVYIHGGGLQQWYGSDYEYCGDSFCRKGVILVSISYRLNVFGFFCHPELREEQGHCGNYGLMDQAMAVKWVKENIAGFGGDPDNITVFGQSAGGRSSLALACSPLVKDLISRISVQSAGGLGTMMPEADPEQQEQKGIEFMKSLGCSDLEELRKLDWKTIRDANDRLGFFDGFTLCVDGYSLSEPIDETVVSGRMGDIDVIIGCTAVEGANEKEPPFGSNIYAQVLAFAQIHRRSFVYVFDRKQPGDDAGVPHSCDNRYQFGTLDGSWRPYAEEDDRLAGWMQEYWANFAKTGDPNGEGLPEWKRFEEGNVMKLCIEGPQTVGCTYENRKAAEEAKEITERYK